MLDIVEYLTRLGNAMSNSESSNGVMYTASFFALHHVVTFTKVSFCMGVIPNNVSIRRAKPKQLDKIVYQAAGSISATIRKTNIL